MNFLKTSSDVTSGEKDSLGGSFVRATGLYPATIASRLEALNMLNKMK